MNAIQEACQKVVSRWGLEDMGLTDKSAAVLVGAYINLYGLFGGNRDAEKDWLTTPCPHLGWQTPLEALRANEWEAVSAYIYSQCNPMG